MSNGPLWFAQFEAGPRRVEAGAIKPASGPETPIYAWCAWCHTDELAGFFTSEPKTPQPAVVTLSNDVGTLGIHTLTGQRHEFAYCCQACYERLTRRATAQPAAT